MPEYLPDLGWLIAVAALIVALILAAVLEPLRRRVFGFLRWLLTAAIDLVRKRIPAGSRWLVTSPIGDKVYHLLWWGSILVTAFGSGYYYIKDPNGRSDISIGAITLSVMFGSLTLVQQVLIYNDINEIDKDENEACLKYGSFIGTLFERVSRFFVILSLLMVAGKLAGMLYPFVCDRWIKIGSEQLCDTINPDGSRHHVLFSIGSLAVFLSIFIWNAGALIRGTIEWRALRDESRLAENGSLREKLRKAHEKLLANVRIFAFGLGALLCVVFWFEMTLENIELGGIFAQWIFGLYTLAMIAVLLLRNDSARKRIIKRVI